MKTPQASRSSARQRAEPMQRNEPTQPGRSTGRSTGRRTGRSTGTQRAARKRLCFGFYDRFIDLIYVKNTWMPRAVWEEQKADNEEDEDAYQAYVKQSAVSNEESYRVYLNTQSIKREDEDAYQEYVQHSTISNQEAHKAYLKAWSAKTQPGCRRLLNLPEDIHKHILSFLATPESDMQKKIKKWTLLMANHVRIPRAVWEHQNANEDEAVYQATQPAVSNEEIYQTYLNRLIEEPL